MSETLTERIKYISGTQPNHLMSAFASDLNEIVYRAEAAESERDEARRQLSEAQHAIDVLSNTIVAQDAEIKRLEQAREDIADYRAEIARLTRKAMTA